ncbi:MAG: ABC transporter permease [Oscillospiraceae bacterium]|nr:ABC transporter permease [Oscillospiraceae bacterium]MCD8389591.1 ABC transporter permease [Oscillospiraceae bacterium]
MPELEKKELTLDEPEDSLRKQSQVKEVMKRLFRDRLAVVGMVIFAIYVLIAIFAPILTPYNYAEFSLVEKNQGMSWAHICGTDQYGRDIFSRLLYGTRYSLLLGLGAVVIGLTLGIILGCVAGYFGGWVETLIMRGCDVVQSIPGMLLAVIISVSLGIGVMQTIVALGIGRIALCCRMIRAQFLSQRKLEYVEAAQATNCSKARLMFVHILPNTISPLIVSSTMGVGGTIMMAANLSFIGLGVQEPTPEWGAMLSGAQSLMRHYPYQVIIPGLFMAIFVLSLNLFGDGLRDALDPKLKN